MGSIGGFSLRATAAWLCAGAALLGAAACGGGDASQGRLTVFAAASLADALPRIDPGPEYQFAGSDTLATQIREGAPADVYAAADERLLRELHEAGLAGEPRAFAGNRLVLVVPADGPARIRGVADLGRDGVTFVMADEGVPVGDYTRTVLRNLGCGDLVRRAASFEEDVRGVLAKVALGEADAGFVYATDARAAEGRVRTVEIPERAQPPIRYGIAVIGDDGRGAARAFVDRVLGPRGREVLRAAGFGPP